MTKTHCVVLCFRTWKRHLTSRCPGRPESVEVTREVCNPALHLVSTSTDNLLIVVQFFSNPSGVLLCHAGDLFLFISFCLHM